MSPAASYFVRETASDAPQVSACCLFSASPQDGLHTAKRTDPSVCQRKQRCMGKGNRPHPCTGSCLGR